MKYLAAALLVLAALAWPRRRRRDRVWTGRSREQERNLFV